MGESDAESEYLTVVEAAKTLMVSPATLARWAAAGRIPHTATLDGGRRFLRTEVAKIARRMGREL